MQTETAFGVIGNKENMTVMEFTVGKMAKLYRRYGNMMKHIVPLSNTSMEVLLKVTLLHKHNGEDLVDTRGLMETIMKENGTEAEMELDYFLLKTDKCFSNLGWKTLILIIVQDLLRNIRQTQRCP